SSAPSLHDALPIWPGDGSCGFGATSMPSTLRRICIGVTSTPNGSPHQPSSALYAMPRSCALKPQLRHEIWYRLLQWVSTTIDQIRYDVRSSTGPGPWQCEQRPLWIFNAFSRTSASGSWRESGNTGPSCTQISEQ